VKQQAHLESSMVWDTPSTLLGGEKIKKVISERGATSINTTIRLRFTNSLWLLVAMA
jgi:hypothetical protein